jgi:hypothetical protein
MFHKRTISVKKSGSHQNSKEYYKELSGTLSIVLRPFGGVKSEITLRGSKYFSVSYLVTLPQLLTPRET